MTQPKAVLFTGCRLLQAFYDAIIGANTVISALLWCFACLSAGRDQQPEVTFDESDGVKAMLEAEMQDMRAGAGPF